MAETKVNPADIKGLDGKNRKLAAVEGNEEDVQGLPVFSSTETVKFKASYSKDWKGNKHLKEGEVYELHILHAKGLEAKGIGKIEK